MKRAVITGLGAVTPLGNSVNEFWKNLSNGKSGAGPIMQFDATQHKTQFACEVKGFDPLQWIDKKEARKMDLYCQYAVAATEECLNDSGIDLSRCDLRKAGVIVATGIGGIKTFEEEVAGFVKSGSPRFSPFFVTKMIANIASGQISLRYGFRGVNYAVVSACASSNHALSNALDLIRLGRANMVIAGGSEAAIIESAVGGFNASRALSTRNDSPETASRPFDPSRDGFVLGEGAGILLVEELEHALNRGAKIYCELAGYGAAADAYHVTATHPEGLGAAIAMEDALADASLKAPEVDYINAHATSTPLGDVGECKAIIHALGDEAGRPLIGATKSMTGHLLGAAGAVEAISCVKSIETGIVPPIINTKEIDPAIPGELNFVFGKAVESNIDVALNNTFGFGGHTSTTVFRKYKNTSG